MNISSTTITGDTSFVGTIFNNKVSFMDSKFEGSISFASSHFMKEAGFIATQFGKFANFYEAIFVLKAEFNNACFNKGVKFENAIFDSTYFIGAKFNDLAEFEKTKFRGDAYFNKVIFNGQTYFIGAEFETDVIFNEAEFHSDASFNGAIFNGDVDFSRSRFNRTAVINAETCFKKKLKLDEIKGSRLRLEARFNEDLQGQLSLKNPDISYLLASWQTIKNQLAYDGSAYLFLVKNYNNLVRFNEADDCYYQYRKLRRKKLPIGQRLFDSIVFLSLGYGIYPLVPLVVGSILIVIFAIIYSIGNPAFSMQNATLILRHELTLSTAIFVTQTRMESLNEFYYFISLIEGMLGIILMACFVVSLAKKTLR